MRVARARAVVASRSPLRRTTQSVARRRALRPLLRWWLFNLRFRGEGVAARPRPAAVVGPRGAEASHRTEPRAALPFREEVVFAQETCVYINEPPRRRAGVVSSLVLRELERRVAATAWKWCRNHQHAIAATAYGTSTPSSRREPEISFPRRRRTARQRRHLHVEAHQLIISRKELGRRRRPPSGKQHFSRRIKI